MQWLPPFSDTNTKMIYENATQMTGARFSPDGKILFFSDNTGTVAVYLDDPALPRYQIVRSGTGNRGGNGANGAAATTPPVDPNAAPPQAAGRAGVQDPGGTLLGVGGGGGGGGRGGGGGGGRGGGAPAGGPVLLSADGSSVYLQGTIGGGGRGNGTTAPQPTAFLDKLNIKTGERARLFQGDTGDLADRISTVLDPEAKRLILTKENAKTPPQQFLYDNGMRKQLTMNEDLFPDLTNMQIVPHLRYQAR